MKPGVYFLVCDYWMIAIVSSGAEMSIVSGNVEMSTEYVLVRKDTCIPCREITD